MAESKRQTVDCPLVSACSHGYEAGTIKFRRPENQAPGPYESESLDGIGPEFR
jgi:hypothetical protein